MIDMKCPACGAEGRAPNDRINTRLVCRKCVSVFHVTPSGRAVLGEPANSAAAAMPAHGVPAPDGTQKVDQWIERTTASVFSTRSLLIASAVLLIGFAIAFISMRRPETLQDRVRKAAVAAVQGDLQTIRQMAATGSNDDLVKWYQQVRERCDSIRLQLGTGKLVVEVDVRQEDLKQGVAETVAQLDTEDHLSRKGNALPDPSQLIYETQSVSLPVAWRSEGWSGWKLDARRSMELTGSAP
jgi:hypothetical protein